MKNNRIIKPFIQIFAYDNIRFFLGLIFSKAFLADCSAWRQFYFLAEVLYSG